MSRPLAGFDVGEGGSAANVTVHRRLVTKTVGDDARAKLLAEARWLQWITTQREHPELQARFPTVFALPTAEAPALVMQRLDGVCARTAVLAGVDEHVTRLVHEAVSFAFEELPRLGSRRGDATAGRWCDAHLARGLDAARREHRDLALVLGARRLVVGDISLPNPLSESAGEVREVLGRGVPRRVCVIHGDLHLGNVLVDTDGGGFHLVDPRGGWSGDRCFDPAYDVAKLLHEPHYVQARHGAASIRLRPRGEDVVLEAAEGVRARGVLGESLTRLARMSLSLAGSACEQLSEADPLVAARATLITGMHFVSMLRFPHTRAYQPAALLGHGTVWLASGLHAVRHQYGPAHCRALWEGLLATPRAGDWPVPMVARALDAA